MNRRPVEGVQSHEYAEVVTVARKHLNAAGGGALCVYHHGAPVLDLWTGFKDPAARTPWESDTMAMSWSTTKGVASTALHLLADRGLISYEEPIGTYWPEYAVNGKQQTTVRQLLSMEAGLFDIRHLIGDPRLILDHAGMAAALAGAAPAHQPGAKNAYHAFTYGWLVGELVRRVAGDSLGAFVQAEIAEPLGLDGCYVGTPTDQLGRVAAFPNLAPESQVVRVLAKAINPLTSLFGVSLARMASAFVPIDGNDVIRTTEFLQAEVPSVNGVFTARSLARLYAALGSDDGVDGVRLWSPETRAKVSEQQNDRRDRVVPVTVRWRLGYHCPFPRKRSSPSAFGFYGAYGSGVFADPERRLAVGLVCQQAKGLPLTKLIGPMVEAAGRV